MTWEQVYNPFGNVGLSAIVATMPLAVLFYLLAVRRVAGHIAGFAALLVALSIACFVYQMPAVPALLAVVSGTWYGVFPIFWIIFTAIFVYNLAVETGRFEIIKSSILLITEDGRLQVLLIAFCFGAFLEGAAGFGAPVAITAGLLVGLGCRPLHAAGLCLLANTAPVAFGSIGIPIIVAAQITGLEADHIGAVVGRQLPFLSVLVPFWIVALMGGIKAMREVFPACLTVGTSFALIQFVSSNYLGPELPDILSALGSILAMIILLQVWKPKTIWKIAEDSTPDTKALSLEKSQSPSETLTFGVILKAWSPFLLLTVFVILWGIKPINLFLDSFTIKQHLIGLDQVVMRTAPVVAEPKPIEALVKIEWLKSPGTAMFFAGLLSALIFRVSIPRTLHLYWRTLRQLFKPLMNVACILGLAYLMNFSGMSTTFGLVLAGTGSVFPFFSPILGWIGVFLTGSDTASNALFGQLQIVTAGRVGMDPVLAIAANSSGGVAGKMISPLSLAVATAATGLVGKEGDLIRFTVVHSILFVLLIAVLTWLQAGPLAWMLP